MDNLFYWRSLRRSLVNKAAEILLLFICKVNVHNFFWQLKPEIDHLKAGQQLTDYSDVINLKEEL